MKAVCDTCSLIRLNKGCVVEKLGDIFDVVYIPKAVQEELNEGDSAYIIDESFFEVAEVQNMLFFNLGSGEREVISLAKELDVNIVITDDEKARKKAEKYNLIVLRSFDVLRIAKQKGFIRSVKPILELIKKNADSLNVEFEYNLLQKVGE